MPGSIFRDTLRADWRQMLYWGIGMGFFGAFLLIAIPNVEALQTYAQLVEVLPESMRQMVGLGDIATLTTPEGFIAFGFFGYGILVFAIYAVLAGLSVTANDEDDGIMDVVLSLPIPRWRLVVEKVLAYVVISVGIIIMAFVMMLIGTLFSSLDPDMGRLVASGINLVPATLLMLAITVFFSAVMRRKSMATMIAAGIIIGSYFMNFIGEAATGTFGDVMGGLSFFNYYDNQGVMANGLDVGNVVLLLVVASVLFVGSVWAFNRRDVGL